MLAIMIAALFFIAPAYAQESIDLETTSDQGSFLVQITWTPGEVGEENTFDVVFVEPETGTILEDIKYEFSLLHNDTQVQETNKVDRTGARQSFTFDEPGWYMIKIDNIDGLEEGAKIPIQITPEFPVGTLAVMAAVGGAVAASKINLFRLKSE